MSLTQRECYQPTSTQCFRAVSSKNATDGTALESFFADLDRALDGLTLTY